MYEDVNVYYVFLYSNICKRMVINMTEVKKKMAMRESNQ